VEAYIEIEPRVATAPAGRGWWRRAGKIVAVGGWLYLGAILAAWALLAAADLWWPATVLQFSPRWLLLPPAGPLALLAALLRPRALTPVLLAFLLAGGPVMGFCVPWQRLLSAPPPGTSFRLLTCNIHYEKIEPLPLDQLIETTRPDFVVLQEYRTYNHSELLARPDWHVHRERGQFLASRHPIRRTARLGPDSGDTRGSVIRYELDTPAGLVTLFSLHFASPRQGLTKVIHEKEGAPEDLTQGSRLRWTQSEYLAGHLAGVTGPVLVVGDFNTPPESAIFRRLWGSYTDAFGSAGWGWGYTFLGGRTRVRIDHILAGPGWSCDRCWVGPFVGSPHRPVLADLTWPAGE
jgi:endonuclease/exonuclease/phosphatase (EEP) superfamily protein YafD